MGYLGYGIGSVTDVLCALQDTVNNTHSNTDSKNCREKTYMLGYDIVTNNGYTCDKIYVTRVVRMCAYGKLGRKSTLRILQKILLEIF